MRIVLILAVALIGFASSVSAQSANGTTPLAELPTEVRDDIARICLPIQYRDGATAYRNCVKEQVSARKETRRVDQMMDTFSSLSFDDRYAIQQSCGSTNTDSARTCIADQIIELVALPEPALGDITNDEQYVMQQTCFKAQSKLGAAAYRQCQLNEIASIKTIATPDFTGLDAIERNELQLKCSANQSQLIDYRSCLVSGIEQLNSVTTNATVAVAQISQPLANPPGNPTIAIAPAATVRVQTNPSNLKPQLIQPRVEAQPEPVLAPAVSVQTASEPVETFNDVNQPQAQSTTETDPTVTPAVTVDTTTNGVNADVSEGTNNADPLGESASNTVETLKNFVIDAFNGLSTQGKMLLGAVILMPLALLVLLTGRKRRDFVYDDEDESEYAHEDLKSRVRPRAEPIHPNSQAFDDEDISMSWEAEVDSLFDDAPTIQPKPSSQPIDQSAQTAVQTAVQGAEQIAPEPIDYSKVDEYAPTRLITKPPTPAAAQRPPSENQALSKTTHDAASTVTHEPAHEPTTQASTITSTQNGFASWLHELPKGEQHSLAIEFLLYWIAFGDERYEASLKQQIFQAENPSHKEIVKRWVLKEDVYAFADVIDWLQRNTTQIQKVQIVRLLMAMLVNGHEPTPVQNTLFRFLSDAFYFKDPTLDEMFEEDFQASLPAMPRVDRMAWWDRQSAGTIASWNARKLNNSDEITRLAAQLGVDGEARSEHVEAAYELAARRCSPARFDHLGKNEHQLIASRLNRLEHARDGLLEALA